MKPGVPVLCLLVVAMAAAAEPSAGDDTNPRPRAAARYRIREVRFSGDPAFEPDALRKVLKQLKVRRIIPGIWRSHPPYASRAVDADLARLRSFYLSHRYFDARVAIGDVTFDGHEATVILDIRSGPKSAIRHVKIDGLIDEHKQIATGPKSEFPVDVLCKCLLDAQQAGWTQGRIDFAVELAAVDVDGPATGERKWVDLAARVTTGHPYTVGRISFSGHHGHGDSTLRGAMTLEKRGVFDGEKLRRSLVRLNQSRLFEPLTPDDVEIRRNPVTLTADLTIRVRERPRGRWSLSGPMGPIRFAGSLHATISSRLPGWGRGIFEASTYYVTFGLIGFSNPVFRLLPVAPKKSLRPLFVVERPYLPGQAAFSGFMVSPQLSARRMLANYGLTHLDRGALAALGADTPDSSGLLIPVERGAGQPRHVGFLICDPPKTRARWLRRAGLRAADLALGVFQPF